MPKKGKLINPHVEGGHVVAWVRVEAERREPPPRKPNDPHEPEPEDVAVEYPVRTPMANADGTPKSKRQIADELAAACEARRAAAAPPPPYDLGAAELDLP